MNVGESSDIFDFGAPPKETLPIAGYNVQLRTKETLLDEIIARAESRQKTLLFFANTNFIVKCRFLREGIAHENVIVVNDGVGMDIAAILTNGRRFIENLNGTDFVPLLLSAFPTPPKVFLYGGRPDVVKRAAEVLRAAGQQIVGYCDGYQPDNTAVVAAIENSGADVILVALGNPLQESWILEHATKLPPHLFIGVGALFDFLSGRARRAPNWIRKIRMEWFYRLCHEPRRLLRRYSLDLLIFANLCWRSKRQTQK